MAKRKTKKIYSKNDFNSKDGMLTSVWGPPMWHFIHTISFNYPIQPTLCEKKYYRNFILGLQHILPCGKCRKNLTKNLKSLPLQMKSMKNRETFSRWVYDLHEKVNKMLGKSSGLSFKQVRERYEHFRARCTIDRKSRKKGRNKSRNKSRKKGDTRRRRKTRKIEKGCTTPLYGKKSKCIMKIVPHDKKGQSLEIDKRCIKRRNPK
jgi:hypothetical protein